VSYFENWCGGLLTLGVGAGRREGVRQAEPEGRSPEAEG